MTKVYRNISTPVTVMGLEIIDLFILILCFLFLFNVSDRIVVNLILLLGFYGVLRYLKKGKPPGYAIHLAKFIMSPIRFEVSLKDPLGCYLPSEKNEPRQN